MIRYLSLCTLFIFQAYASWESVDRFGEKSSFDWATVKELPEEKEVFLRAVLEAYKNFSPETLGLTKNKVQFAEEAFSKLEKEFLDGSVKILTVKKQDRVVGFIAFYPTEIPGQIYFSQMSIDPSYWRRGLGTELIASVMREFPETDHFVLITRKINVVARKFWEHLGFTECCYMHEGYDSTKYIGYELHPPKS